jgi:hypothetical protein
VNFRAKVLENSRPGDQDKHVLARCREVIALCEGPQQATAHDDSQDNRASDDGRSSGLPAKIPRHATELKLLPRLAAASSR